jgi:hypothetical protein
VKGCCLLFADGAVTEGDASFGKGNASLSLKTLGMTGVTEVTQATDVFVTSLVLYKKEFYQKDVLLALPS